MQYPWFAPHLLPSTPKLAFREANEEGTPQESQCKYSHEQMWRSSMCGPSPRDRSLGDLYEAGKRGIGHDRCHAAPSKSDQATLKEGNFLEALFAAKNVL